MSAKLTTLGVFKRKILWNKIYDILISVYDVTNKVLSRGSNYIVDMAMRLKFANFSISMRQGTMKWILQRFDWKKYFVRSGLGPSSLIRGLH